MTRPSIFDYKFTQFSVSKSFTDAMWRWSMTIPRGYPVPETWQPIDAISPDTQNCVLVGFPITKNPTTARDFKGVTVSGFSYGWYVACLLYTSDAADDLLCVDLGGRRIIKKKNNKKNKKNKKN